MKSIWSLIVVAGAIVAVLFFISSRGKKAPYIPIDNTHTKSIMFRESCVTCHAPGKQAPLKDSHPPKEQCFTCHKINKP